MELKEAINKIWNKDTYTNKDRQIFNEFKQNLSDGKIRAATKMNDNWQVNHWVKRGILIGFKMGNLKRYHYGRNKIFIDKDTYPEKKIKKTDNIRIVPGGSSIRDGAFLSESIIIMPPAYVNVGAYIDRGCLIDSHALVGSCAQIGKNVHLSAASQLGGVIEPIGAKPVIIEDDVFIGGNCGIYEGVVVRKKAILAAGVILTSSTPVFDATKDKFIDFTSSGVKIPEKAVVVAGSRPLKSNNNINIYCPVIVKYRDKKSEKSVNIEDIIR